MWSLMPIIVLKIVLPATLLICCLVRQCLFSLFYGLLFLIWPFVSSLSSCGEIKRSTKTYLKVSALMSGLIFCAQLVFYGFSVKYLTTHKPLETSIPSFTTTSSNEHTKYYYSDCDPLMTMLRAVGLQRPTTISVAEIVRYIGPDVGALVMFALSLLVCFGYKPRRHVLGEFDDLLANAVLVGLGAEKRRALTTRYQERLQKLRLSELCSLILLALCGILHPSILSLVYLVAFLGVVTYWSLYLPVRRRVLGVLRLVLCCYCAIHLTLLYMAQMEVVQALFNLNSLPAKMLGLPVVFSSSCVNNTLISPTVLNPVKNWAIYFSPAAMLLYFAYSAFRYKPQDHENRGECDIEAEADPFLSGASPQTRRHSASPTGGVTSPVATADDDAPISPATVVPNGGGGSGLISPAAISVAPRRPFSFEQLFEDADWTANANGNDASAVGGHFKCSPPDASRTHVFLAGFLSFIVRHSYVLSLGMMMAWAIVYHCWLSFVWLALACFIWLTSDSRATCLKWSPFIVAYAEILICCEFIYGIRSNIEHYVHDVWPEETAKAPLLQIGFITPRGPACIPLLAKLFFSAPFWILLRVHLREEHLKSHRRSVEERADLTASFSFITTHGQTSPQGTIGNSLLGATLVKYWIYVVGLTLMLISIREPVVVYGVLYMGFFLVVITVFQISFRVWRIMLFSYWSMLVVYSICILLFVYTYQFHDIPVLWRNWTGWETNNASLFQFKDFGLVKYDSGSLFIQLLTPISFLIVVILQLKFFHVEFMQVTDMKRPVGRRSVNNTEPKIVTKNGFYDRLPTLAFELYSFFWKLADLHISKFVAFTLIIVAVGDVSVVNMILVVVVPIMLVIPQMHSVLSVFANLWCSAIIIVRMLFQFKFVGGTTISVDLHGNCSIYSNQEWNNIDPAKWTGFEKTDNLAYYLKDYLAICILLTFQSIVKLRRKYLISRKQSGTGSDSESYAGSVLFPGVKRKNADESIKSCVKYLLNYWFHEFGLETCYVVMVIDIGIRMDAAALLYVIWLLVLLCLPKPVLKRMWWAWVLFLAVMIPIQFAMCIGLPPSPCAKFSWMPGDDKTSSKGATSAPALEINTASAQQATSKYFGGLAGIFQWDQNLYGWLYLPSYDRSRVPDSWFLIADFFVLLCAACQLAAFRAGFSSEVSDSSNADNAISVASPRVECGAMKRSSSVPNVQTSENDDAPKKSLRTSSSDDAPETSPDDRLIVVNNPVPNFILYTKSYLDMVKVGVFCYLHWFTLIVIFAAGFGRKSLFACGYLIAAFILLRKGNDLYLESFAKVRFRWYMLLIYNVLSILLKVSLQFIGCGYLEQVCHTCPVLIKLFSIACLTTSHSIKGLNEKCVVLPQESEMFYDGVCFAFLMIQMRIFHSWYFKHAIASFKAQRILSARGAVVISQLMKTELKQQEAIERKTLSRLVRKTAKIRDNYLKKMEAKRAAAVSASNGRRTSSVPRRTCSVNPIEHTNYWHAKRSGDYYMFDYDSETDSEIEKEIPSDLDLPGHHENDHKTGLGPLQIAHMVLSKDFHISETVEECKEKMRQISSSDCGAASSSDRTMSMSLEHTISSTAEEPHQIMIDKNHHIIVSDVIVEDASSSTNDVTINGKSDANDDGGGGDADDDRSATSSARPLTGGGDDGAASDGGDVPTRHGRKRRCSPLGELKAAAVFMLIFVSSILEAGVRCFNRLSRHCRYVAYVLKHENRQLMEALGRELETETNVRTVQKKLCDKEIGRRIRKIPTTLDIEIVQKQVKQFEQQHNVLVRFFIAFYYVLFSRTELLCYMMMILDHMFNASILSLPLPILAFFWGTLCSPRPPKSFWISVITYTVLMIMVKFVIQFDFMPNVNDSEPNQGVSLLSKIGLDKDSSVGWDVALLMVLFFHRYVLKMLGLWKDVSLTGDVFRSAHPDLDSSNHSRYSMAQQCAKSETSADRNSTAVIADPQHQHKSSASKVVIKDQRISMTEDRMSNDDLDSCVSKVRRDAELHEMRSRSGSRIARKKSPGKKPISNYFYGFYAFYCRLLKPEYHYVTDMYSVMFICDLICFLILAFGYSSFGVAADQGDVVSDLKSNKVPLPFVTVLIALMVLIIIDRAIYLRKSVVGKLIFQYLLVVCVHAWIFFILPTVTDKPVHINVPAQMWYFVKCVYFLLSAWQIKNGYRSRRYGNALTKRYNLLNFCLFQGFMVAPFLFELRTLVDWIWTKTGMPLFDFFSMENIYATVYRSKCMRKMESAYPTIRGKPQGALIKYGLGLPILLLIVVLLWLPLLLFALVNSIGRGLLPHRATLTVAIKGFPPLYESIAEDYPSLSVLPREEYNRIIKDYTDKGSLMFLRDYANNAVQKVQFDKESDTAWYLSQPARQRLLDKLHNPKVDLSIVVTWKFTRPRESSEKEPSTHSSSVTVPLSVADKRTLLAMLEPPLLPTGATSSQLKPKPAQLSLRGAFPAFVEVPSGGEVQPVLALLEKRLQEDAPANATNTSTNPFSCIHLTLVSPFLTQRSARQTSSSGGTAPTHPIRHSKQQHKETLDHWPSSGEEYWIVMTNGTGDNAPPQRIEMTVFVDKVFPSVLEVFTSKGIIGVYVVVVLAAGKFMRSLVVTSPLEIIITEMPNVERVLQLCLDIYLVREARDFLLELDLWAKLIFLIRSPETLIKWTRLKME